MRNSSGVQAIPLEGFWNVQCVGFMFREDVRTYDQDVVELLHAIDIGQQLVDYSVVDSCAARHAATLLANCINLIEYDDVKAAVCTELLNKNREGGRLMCYG